MIKTDYFVKVIQFTNVMQDYGPFNLGVGDEANLEWVMTNSTNSTPIKTSWAWSMLLVQ